MDWAVGEAKSMVEPSIMAPWSFERTETISPEIVTGLPPALRMEPFGRVIAFRWGLALGGETRVAPATGGRAKVLLSKRTLLLPTDMTWPAIIVWVPGASVEVPIIRPPLEARWTVWPFRRIGESVGAGVGRAFVVPSITRWVAPIDTTCPPIVA